jgi:PD-(D/E)XK nuclease superfamily
MLKKSKSIEEIYNEVKEYDLVITNDAPLATALNKLVEKPRLDYFAMTPRQIASKFAALHFDKIFSKAELILEISRLSGKPLKQVHQSIEKIFEVWNNTGLLESCVQFLTKEENEFLPYFDRLASIEIALERFDEEFYGDKKIAVAGIELFNLLDKQILPRKKLYPDVIKLFNDEVNAVEKTYLFDSSDELINQIVKIVDKKNCDDIAIVLNTESEYLDIIKSRLKENGVRLQIKTYLSEDIYVRDIISFVDSSFRVTDLKIEDLSGFERLFKADIEKRFNQFYFMNYMNIYPRDIQLKEVYNMMTKINSYSYEELLAFLRDKYRLKISEELVRILKALNIYDKKINEDNFNLINYFIKYIDVEISKNNEGVLFANAQNSAFVDKPVIIYIGMDESWTKLHRDKAYIDKDEEQKKNLDRFQILLSQGKHKLSFVLNLKNNINVIPCYYFNILADKNIKSFEDNFFKPVQVNFNKEKREYLQEREALNVPNLPDIESISPSSLNRYIICPKQYSFDKLMPKEDKPHFLRGTLLHNFAEFYFNHPQYTKENFDIILDHILDEFKGFVREVNVEVEKTSFTIGMESVIKFLDEKNLYKIELKEEVDETDNFLFKKLNKKKLYLNTEYRIVKNNSNISGKLDLFAGNIIIDYKSTKEKKKGHELLNEFKLELMKERKSPEINFQTIAYIASKREEITANEIEFIYSYILSQNKDIIGEKESGNNIVSRIKYLPLTFREYILSKEFFESLKNDFLIKIKYENYRRILEDNFEKINFFDKESMIENLEDLFYDLAIKKLGFTLKDFGRNKDSTFRKETIQKVFDSLRKVRTGGSSEGIIFKDDADYFLELVNKTIDEINVYQKSSFPNKPIFDLRDVCKKCDYLNICLGNKLWSAEEGADIE